jgi:hypothetical protein
MYSLALHALERQTSFSQAFSFLQAARDAYPFFKRFPHYVAISRTLDFCLYDLTQLFPDPWPFI